MKSKGMQNLIAAMLGLAIGAMLVFGVFLEGCHAADKQATAKDRIIYAALTQYDQRVQGHDLYSVAYGPENKWLVMRCAEFIDAEIVKNLVKDLVSEWKVFGFTEVMFTSGEVMMILDVGKAYDKSIGKEKM